MSRARLEVTQLQTAQTITDGSVLNCSPDRTTRIRAVAKPDLSQVCITSVVSPHQVRRLEPDLYPVCSYILGLSALLALSVALDLQLNCLFSLELFPLHRAPPQVRITYGDQQIEFATVSIIVLVNF